MDFAGAIIVLLAVCVGFALARVPLSRRAISELRHPPDPTTQVAVAGVDEELDECDAWLAAVDLEATTFVFVPLDDSDSMLRAAGFSIYSRPANSPSIWQDDYTRHRDCYPRPVACLIARDRLVTNSNRD